ncbi:MAG: phage terminase large subunit family protein [Verrucomicrobiota bacterium]
MNSEATVLRANLAIAQTWKPPPKLSVSEWAAERRFLSAESSAEAGKWRNERTPYMIEPMDEVPNPLVEQITFKTSAQIGKTEFENNVAGYFIDMDPCPMLMVQPVEKMGKSWVNERFDPMMRDCPCFDGKLHEDTQFHKGFMGGFLAIGWAKSASSLASRPIRVLLLDEVDRYDLNVKGEGDPVNQAIKRTTTFHNRKVIAVSTPKLKGSSRIDALYDSSDQRLYMVPCPHCGDFHFLKWEDIKFDKANPLDTARWVCPSCTKPVDHIQKRSMLAAGEWRAQMPFRGHAGFHINELYSPWKTWGEVAEDYLEAKKTEETLQTWVNLSQGLSFEPKTEKVEADTLKSLVEEYDHNEIPNGVLWASAGVDTQNDRFELSVWGFGLGDESWHLEKKVILGDPKSEEVKQDLDDFLKTVYTREDGVSIPISAAFVDSGGNRTKDIYNFARGKAGRRIFAIKGASSSNPFDNTVEVVKQGYSKSSRCSLIIVHSAKLKKQLYDAFRKTLKVSKEKTEEGPLSGPGLVHFGKHCDDDFFGQITAEKMVRKRVNGYQVIAWRHDESEGDYPRNEDLDCAAYARAAMVQIKPNFEKLGEKFSNSAKKEAKPEEKREMPKKKKPNPRRQRKQSGSWASRY